MYKVAFFMPKHMHSQCLENMHKTGTYEGHAILKGAIKYKKEIVHLWRQGNKFDGEILATKNFANKEHADAFADKLRQVEGMDEVQVTKTEQ